ncbi:MAG: methenyltetrahydromethanopterin cyclohydrolase [Planctomycetaceae bacterium]|nr:methenyltetrahydromethanopterin cyclohydrolase [Planctomycetaceae bacterium]
MKLNRRAAEVCEDIAAQASFLRVGAHQLPNQSKVWDFGVDHEGGLAAGLQLARVCTSGLADISLHSDERIPATGISVQVMTDHPVAACMASQYAGWQINPPNYFAMGSGPMRAAAGSEDLFERLNCHEAADNAVGVLETGTLPSAEVTEWIASRCGVATREVQLCVAPTSSQAGNLQIVARSVETALHKMYDLGFDLLKIRSGRGVAPLPPVAADDLAGIGRTNDAILYGACVTLWVQGDDDALAQVVQQVPSCASADFGEPFSKIFARYDNDFYKIDPHLFSPAMIRLINLESGRVHQAGEARHDILATSFLGGSV